MFGVLGRARLCSHVPTCRVRETRGIQLRAFLFDSPIQTPPGPTSGKCEAIKKDGDKCECSAVDGTNFCGRHRPEGLSREIRGLV